MRIKSKTAGLMGTKFLFAAALFSAGNAADAVAESAVPAASISSKFSEAQREYIHSWIRELTPECPRDLATVAVERFLDELQRRSPAELHRLMSPEFPVREYHSLLYQMVATQLTGEAHATLREDVARRRLKAILASSAGEKSIRGADVDELVAKIKTLAPVHPRRLFEGRMDDDEVALLLKKAGEPAEASLTAKPVAPKELSAGEIVAEFSRRNQEGSAWQQLKALTIQGRLTTAAGEELEVFLFKMSPDRYRMAMVVGGTTRLLSGFDGRKYWQQIRGHPPQILALKDIGTRRYLGEFADPLVSLEGVSYERLEDGSTDGHRIFRIAVRRRDQSRYIAWIDSETFDQVGREMDDKVTVRYSDFRAVAGITMTFREESTDAEGRKNVLTLSRITPNGGLIQAFFEPPVPGTPGYFELEQMIAHTPTAAAK